MAASKHPRARLTSKSDKKTELLTAICQGLAAYQAYLAVCKLHSVRSEYIFYEAIARIAQGNSYSVRCEYPLKSISKSKVGDKRRCDFVFSKDKKLFEKKFPDRAPDDAIAVKIKYITSISKLKPLMLSNLKAKELKHCAKFCIGFGRADIIRQFTPNMGRSKFSVISPIKQPQAMESQGIRYAARWYSFEYAKK